MNGLDPMEGIRNWDKVKKMKFHLNYDINVSHEENIKSGAVEVVKDTGPTLGEIKERQRKKDLRAQLREQRLKKEKQLKHPKRSQWWQKKR